MKVVLESMRTWLYARAKVRVLVLGDSHVRVFSHWLFMVFLPRTAFDVVYVPGATATGVGNLKSTSGAYKCFRESLNASSHDLVMVNLGEVDTAYTIWKRADRRGGDVEMMFEAAVRNYCTFLSEVCACRFLVVLSAPLPTLVDQSQNKDPSVKMRDEVNANQRDRTALALRFNERIAQFCADRGVPYVSSDAVALGRDGLVRASWRRRRRPDHHYAHFPYALWLVRVLRGLIHRVRGGCSD